MGQGDAPAVCSVRLQQATVNMHDTVCSIPVTMDTIRPHNSEHEHHTNRYHLPSYFSVPTFQAITVEVEVTVTLNTRTETFMFVPWFVQCQIKAIRTEVDHKIQILYLVTFFNCKNYIA
jgi:hypothetical protein